MKKILTLCLCGLTAASLTACGNTVTNEKSEKNEISLIETSDITEASENSEQNNNTSKEDKNGFDKSTNNTIQYYGHTIELPAYYEADDSNNPISSQNYYAYENGMPMALLQIQVTSTGTDKDNLADDFEENISGLKTLENFKEEYRGKTTLAGDPAYYSDFSCTTNNTDFDCKVVATKHDDSSSNMYALFLMQAKNSEYDYFSDFDKIIASITFGNNSEDIATTTPTPEPTPEISLEYSNALSKAHDYLDFTSFSYSGLIDQLEFEGFSTEACTYAADNCGADWNEQAALKAQSYLDFTSFSRQGLIDQLVFDGFTAEQAEYGVSAVGY